MNHQTKTTRPATDGRPRYYGQRLLYYAMAILSADLFLLWAFFVTLVQDTLAGNETGGWSAAVAANCAVIALVAAILLPRGCVSIRNMGEHTLSHILYSWLYSPSSSASGHWLYQSDERGNRRGQ